MQNAVSTIAEGVNKARDILLSGQALTLLKQWIEVQNSDPSAGFAKLADLKRAGSCTMTELLIIKAGDTYYRYRDDIFEPCSINKASVFPMEQTEQAKLLCRKLAMTGVVAPVLKKLTIIEEHFEQE